MGTTGFRRLVGVAVAGATMLTVSVAGAQEVFFEGTTLGAFNGGTPTTKAGIAGLTFENSTFSDMTAGGFVAFGGNPYGGPGVTTGTGPMNEDNFGSFYLAPTNTNYTAEGTTFTLLINFTEPDGITGGSTATYQAGIIGSVTSDGAGGVFVDFLNNTQVFTFSDATDGTGTFTLFVNDVSVNPSQAAAINGHIIAGAVNGPPPTVVPEPATMTLLATGLAGLLGARARRRKNANA